MSRRKKHKKRKAQKESAQSAAPPRPRRAQLYLLAALAALLVVQVLLPADSPTAVHQGSGMPLVMIWLILLAGWLLALVWRGGKVRRPGATDFAVLALVVWHTISAVWATQHAAPRPAVNVMWQWVGFWIAFFLVRQLVVCGREIRALTAIMIGLGVALSAHGGYQVMWEQPEARRQYKADPQGQLQLALQDVNPSPLVRKQFEQRLNSPEPLATFSLTNSLAGTIATWLVIAAGVGLHVLGWRPWRRGMLTALGLSLAAMAICLYRTNSRTAALAALGGLLLLLILFRRDGARPGAKRFALAAGALCIFAALGFGVLQVDRPALAAARTSLTYRFQYWQAALGLVGDYPWLGCGPGNFQDSYTAYKLPQASETVADPHNLIIEVWSTAGTPALIALLVMLGCFFIQSFSNRPSDEGRETNEDIRERENQRTRTLYLLSGGLAGALLAWLLSYIYLAVLDSTLSFPLAFTGTVIVFAVVAFLREWIDTGELSPTVLSIGVFTLLVNLLAAGGIGSHGVAGSLWLLMALTLNLRDPELPASQLPKGLATLALFVVLVMAAVCQMTAYGPVIKSRTPQGQALLAEMSGRDGEAVDRLREAAAADPLDAKPYRELARLAGKKWLESMQPAVRVPKERRNRLRAAYIITTERWLELAPRSSAARRDVGDVFLHAYERSKDKNDLTAAVEAYEEAVKRYPNSNGLHARLAWAHHLAKDDQAAARAATEALRLDRLNPHPDRKLNSPYQKIRYPDIGADNTQLLMERLVAKTAKP